MELKETWRVSNAVASASTAGEIGKRDVEEQMLGQDEETSTCRSIEKYRALIDVIRVIRFRNPT